MERDQTKDTLKIDSAVIISIDVREHKIRED